MDTARATGRVRWFNAEKSYGFIIPDAGGMDLFFHLVDVKASGKSVIDGQKVTFKVEQGPKGPRAIDVVPATDLSSSDANGD